MSLDANRDMYNILLKLVSNYSCEKFPVQTRTVLQTFSFVQLGSCMISTNPGCALYLQDICEEIKCVLLSVYR